MKGALQLLILIVEFLIQLKRRDDNAKRKSRIEKAKSDPAAYLRQFGRVQHVDSTTTETTVSDSRTSSDRDKSN